MDIILKELVLIDGKKVVASFSATGILTWEGDKSGGISMQNNVLGLVKESSSIRLQFLQFKEGGCLGSAKRAIEEVLISFEQAESVSSWYNAMQDFLGSSGRPKRLLILINPFSGKGLASRVYREVVEPLFEAAGVTLTVRETQFQRHAKDMAKTVDISQYDGIVCVSGDGVLVEVLNGLLERDDWEKAIQMPIGVIPAGSGNGVAKSLLAAAGKPCDALSATFAIIKGQKQSLDIATVVQGRARFHSILLLCWGYISDVDIESEKFRWMGGFRFEFYFSDGYLDLIVLRDCPKHALLKLVLGMQKGTHVKSKYIEYLKVKAFRLAPGERTKGSVQGGYIDVDGEVIARGRGAKGDGSSDAMLYGPPIDVSIQQGLATIFSP